MAVGRKDKNPKVKKKKDPNIITRTICNFGPYDKNYIKILRFMAHEAKNIYNTSPGGASGDKLSEVFFIRGFTLCTAKRFLRNYTI